jgi:hypothetical protein
MQFRSAASQRRASDLGVAPVEYPGRRLLARAEVAARRMSARPVAATVALLGVNLVLIGIFAAAGELAFGDPAEFFRELMPGTWLSVAQLGFVAVIAWSIHTELFPGARLRLDNFWGISVLVFTVFAIDEATQLTIFLADALTGLGALAPAGFKDLDAFLVTVLLLAGAGALLRFAWTLRRYPGAILLLALGVALGAASQTLDSLLSSTSSEFVAEEALKLSAEPFLIGGYLVVLARVLRDSGGSGRPADTPGDRV